MSDSDDTVSGCLHLVQTLRHSVYCLRPSQTFSTDLLLSYCGWEGTGNIINYKNSGHRRSHYVKCLRLLYSTSRCQISASILTRAQP